MGDKIRRPTVRKLRDCYKPHLISQTKWNKELISHFPLQAGAQPSTGRQGSITCNVTWEGSLTPNIPAFPSPSFLCWAWHQMVWDIPWVSWGQLFWLCPLSSPCAPRPPHWWGKEQNKPWLSVSTAQQPWKHLCSQHKSKMNTHQLLWRKLTLPQPKPAQPIVHSVDLSVIFSVNL